MSDRLEDIRAAEKQAESFKHFPPAFPTTFNYGDIAVECQGLSKREYFAAKALQGISGLYKGKTMNDLASDSVELADALIEALNKE